MTAEAKGRDLFIVDNSVSGWTALRYLEEWCGIAKAFDIATGYFEIGALLALDGKWQPLEKIRILMGADVTYRTRKALLDAVRSRALEVLDASMEADKDANPFLHGVPAILEALRSRQIDCRVYDRDKFHAKAYITHAKLEVVGSQALVGSSNFTKPGLTTNIELNVQIQSAREVNQLQEWFEAHWNDASEVTDAVIETISRHTHPYTPFDVYAKALQEFFRGHELTDTEWEETRSKMFHSIDRYQKEAYWALLKIARQHGGAFLCDGVGLGKTFVGLMLIERLVLHEGKRVVLFAPKSAKESVWEPHLREWLPHISGVGGDFSNLAVFSHTDLNRKGDFPERFRRIADLADVVIIDEAHHFRNPGRMGDAEEGIDPSRYHQLFDLLDSAARPKTLYMLTATPINNRLSDFRHMAELFTRRDEAYFGRTLGVNNLRAHFNNMEKALRQTVGHDVPDVAEVMADAQDILVKDQIFKNLVVQRSRTYARESQIRETGNATAFPERRAPQVAAYSIRKTYGRLLDMFEKAFTRKNPLFTLPMYYPLAWYRGEDKSIDPFDENRQNQVVGLIRTNFLKRFESSVVAFELSCDRLLKKLLAFLAVHSETAAEKKRLERWKTQNMEILGYATKRQRDFWSDGGEGTEDDDEVFPLNSTGIVSARDALVVQFTRREIEAVTERLSALSTDQARAEFKLGEDSKDWSVARAQTDVRRAAREGRHPTKILYRPFDMRWTLYTGQARGFMCNPRRPAMTHMLDGSNLALCANRQVNSEYRHVAATRGLITDCTLSTATKERTYVFPLYLSAGDQPLLQGEPRRLNISKAILAQIARAFGLQLDAPYDCPTGLTPEDIFCYLYAILHSLVYRRRYADFLKADFPRVPLTNALDMFRGLARLGNELVTLHLLESPKLDQPITEFIGGRNPEVEKPSWSKNTVWVDKAQTTGFKGVREDVWNFHIGGYQVCEKWLKDRKGRPLTKDGIAHYQKIVVALNETIRLMQKIDEVIEQHGGWPGAFQTGEAPAAGPKVIPFRPRIVQPGPKERYVTCAPLVPLKVAAGAFGDPQHIDDDGFEWAAVETKRRLHPGMFVAQVVGKSMEPAIPHGAYCLFAAPVEGTRQGKTVLVQLRDATDPESGERYTVKRYESEKAQSGDSWRHEKITLKPVNPEFKPIVLTSADEGQLQVVAEFVEVLGGES